MAKRKGRMGSMGDKAYRKTDIELSDEELEILKNTVAEPEKFKPEVSDPKLYDQLIEEVKKSTRKNESVAGLKKRIEKFGSEGFKLVKEILSKLP